MVGLFAQMDLTRWPMFFFTTVKSLQDWKNCDNNNYNKISCSMHVLYCHSGAIVGAIVKRKCLTTWSIVLVSWICKIRTWTMDLAWKIFDLAYFPLCFWLLFISVLGIYSCKVIIIRIRYIQLFPADIRLCQVMALEIAIISLSKMKLLRLLFQN